MKKLGLIFVSLLFMSMVCNTADNNEVQALSSSQSNYKPKTINTIDSSANALRSSLIDVKQAMK